MACSPPPPAIGASSQVTPWASTADLTSDSAAASPPEPYGFAELPVVRSRAPLWDPSKAVVTGLSAQRREVLVTTLLDAKPDHRTRSAGPSIWPLFGALVTGAGFVGAIFTPWGLPLGILLGIPVMVGWFWPRRGSQPAPLQQTGAAA